MKRCRLLPLLLLLIASCAELPKDPYGTLERIREEGRFTVGLISPGPQAPDVGNQQVLLERIARSTGATPDLQRGSAERLLSRLEQGDIDVVVGELTADSPWRRKVTMLPPLERTKGDGSKLELTVVARNGENAWIGLLFREIQAVTVGAQ